MKKLTIASICTAGFSMLAFTMHEPLGYKDTLYGKWEITRLSIYLDDTTLVDSLPPDSYVYSFLANDSVNILMQDSVDTTTLTMGWELVGPNEDTITFSQGLFMYIYNKTPNSFTAQYPLDPNTEEYAKADFEKR